MATINRTSMFVFFDRPDQVEDTPQNVFVELHATKSVTVRESAKAPDIPVDDRTISDDLILNPTVISFTGSITSYLTSNLQDQDDVVIRIFEGLMRTKTLATVVILSPDGRRKSYPNCVVTGFSRSRDSKMANGWSVDLDFKQLLLVDELTIREVEITRERPSDAFLTPPQRASILGTKVKTQEDIESMTHGEITTFGFVPDQPDASTSVADLLNNSVNNVENR